MKLSTKNCWSLLLSSSRYLRVAVQQQKPTPHAGAVLRSFPGPAAQHSHSHKQHIHRQQHLTHSPSFCCWIQRISGDVQHALHTLCQAAQVLLLCCPGAQVAQQHDQRGQALLPVDDLLAGNTQGHAGNMQEACTQGAVCLLCSALAALLMCICRRHAGAVQQWRAGRVHG